MKLTTPILSFLVSLAVIGHAAQPNDLNGVSPRLWSKFDRGLNVTRWFCYQPSYTDQEHLANYLNDADFATFKSLKAHFIRLCLAPNAIDDGGHLDAATVPYVDKALAKFVGAGMAVIYDLHDNGQLKLDSPGQDNASFISFWEDAARHYEGKNENSLVFELVNEPQFLKNPEGWYALQERTVKAIRAIDPRRCIMVSGTSWSGIDTLAKMTPLPERNLIYTFHCYDPFMFTHQGATWTGDEQKALNTMPFPSSPEAVAAMIDKIPAQYQGAVKWYGEQRFDAAYLEKRLSIGVDFGRRNHLPVILGEFGSFPPVAPPDSRARWFEAMRQAFVALRVPNALWGYDDGLGLGRQENADGALKLDPVTLAALYGVPSK